MSSLENQRMQRIIKREVKDTIAKKIQICDISPKIEQVNVLAEDLERVRHLDKCRRIIAYNSLK